LGFPAGEEVECGVDFGVDEVAGVDFVGEPGVDFGEGDFVEGDLFVAVGGGVAAFLEVGGADELDAFVGEAGGGGAFGEEFDVFGPPAGFFEEFALGGELPGFGFLTGFVADEAGGNFDDGLLEGDAELGDEEDIVVRGEGGDADGGLAADAVGVFPVVVLAEFEEFAAVEGEVGHRAHSQKERRGND
jgi:hypothetical protein